MPMLRKLEVRSPSLLLAFTLSELVINEKNTKRVFMFDRAQWFLADMSIALSVEHSLTEALNDIESSLKIIENLRTQNTTPELRTSYLCQLQNYYKFYIDLLMQLHQANPNSGYDVKASEARKRAINP
jgi:hypothetical protein